MNKEDIEKMLAASPGSTVESLAAGFERRAARQREAVEVLETEAARADYRRWAVEDSAMAKALRMAL